MNIENPDWRITAPTLECIFRIMDAAETAYLEIGKLNPENIKEPESDFCRAFEKCSDHEKALSSMTIGLFYYDTYTSTLTKDCTLEEEFRSYISALRNMNHAIYRSNNIDGFKLRAAIVNSLSTLELFAKALGVNIAEEIHGLRYESHVVDEIYKDDGDITGEKRQDFRARLEEARLMEKGERRLGSDFFKIG